MLLFRCFVLFAVLSSTGLTYAQDALREGKVKLNQGDFAGAISIFKTYTVEHPSVPDGFYWLAFSYSKNNQLDDALTASKAAATIKPRLFLNRILMADIYLKKNMFSEAQAECDFMVKEKVKDPQVQLKLAQSYVGQKKYREGTDILEKLSLEQSNNSEILMATGDAYFAQRNPRSIEFYNRALRVESNTIPIKLKMAQAFIYDQKYADALKEYAGVISIDSNNAEAYLNTGLIFYNGGKTNVQQYGSAIFYLTKFISLKPQEHEGYSLLGKTYHALRQFKNAVPNLEKAVEMDTSAERKINRKLLAESYFGVGDFSKTVSTYEQVLKDNSVEMDVKDFVRLGASYKNQKDTIKTIKYYEKAFELDKGYYNLFQEIGFMYYASKRYAEAIPWYQKHVSTAGGDSLVANTYLYLGLCQFYGGKSRPDTVTALMTLKKAAETKRAASFWVTYAQISINSDSVEWGRAGYEMALSLDSTNSSAHFGLGTISYNKKVDEAIMHFEAAVKFEEKNKAAHYWLAKALVKKKKFQDAKLHFQKYLELDPTGPYVKDAKNELNKIR